MRAFELIGAPQGVPWACVCGNATGPLCDTFFENANGRVYICKRCARGANRAFGFTPGTRLDELDAALVNAEDREREHDGLVAEIEELRVQLRSQGVSAAMLQEQLDHALEREQTRAHVDAQVQSLIGGAA